MLLVILVLPFVAAAIFISFNALPIELAILELPFVYAQNFAILLVSGSTVYAKNFATFPVSGSTVAAGFAADASSVPTGSICTECPKFAARVGVCYPAFCQDEGGEGQQ